MKLNSKQKMAAGLFAAGLVAMTTIGQAQVGTAPKAITPASTKGNLPSLPPTPSVTEKKVTPKQATITLESALVVAIDDPNVSAGEAGVLMELKKKEGDSVAVGDLLGQVYDLDAKAKLAVAVNELEAATRQAESQAQVEVAEAAVKVTHNDYLASKEVADKSAGAVSRLELEKKFFEWERAKKQVDVAKTENLVAKATQKVKEAQVQAANNEIERRQIKSNAAGKVVKIYKKVNEWVRPEEPVMQVMRMDKVRVEGFADATVTSPSELKGCLVEVHVQLAGQEKTTHIVKGRVDFVSPIIEGSNNYRRFRVFTEVENKELNGEWLIQPGSPAKMVITLGAPATFSATKARK